MFRLILDAPITGQDDIALQFGTQRFVVDSYYFAIDRDDLPGETAAQRVVRVLKLMLQQWRDAVEACPDGQTVYLPYDFGDNDTGWIECVMGGECVLLPGRARIEGYKVWPNAWRKWEERVPAFQPRKDAAELRMTKDALLAAIDASLAELGDRAE
jgi:hypothetical protein